MLNCKPNGNSRYEFIARRIPIINVSIQESLELDFESGFQLYQDFELRSQVRISSRLSLSFQSDLLASSFLACLKLLIILDIYSFHMLKTVLN